MAGIHLPRLHRKCLLLNGIVRKSGLFSKRHGGNASVGTPSVMEFGAASDPRHRWMKADQKTLSKSGQPVDAKVCGLVQSCFTNELEGRLSYQWRAAVAEGRGPSKRLNHPAAGAAYWAWQHAGKARALKWAQLEPRARQTIMRWIAHMSGHTWR